MKLASPILAALLAASVASAQVLTLTVSPNPAAPGAPITVTAQAATAGLYTPFGCLVSSIRSGAPNGPTVRLFPCTFLPGAIPLYGSASVRTMTWDQNTNQGMAAPGLYWFEIQHQPQQFGGPTSTEWFSMTISDPNNPTPVLSALNAPVFGSDFFMHLDTNQAHAFAPYGVALSVTTNTGIPYAGGTACLDPDFLFNLSIAQDPAFFANFQGALDYLGSTGINPATIHLPSAPGILVIPIHAQAVVFTTGGGFVLSNDLTIHVH